MWFASLALAALPDIDQPLRTGATAGADSAVIVGVEDYFVLPDVPYADRDAQAFYTFAVYTRGVSPDRVQLLTGSVSRERLVSALQAAGKQTRAGGTVFVYFAGHGAASPSTGERILVGADAQPDLETFQARSVSVADVRSWATAGGGNAVLVLDTCYSGKSRAGGEVVAGKRFAVPSYATQATPRVVEWTAAGPDQWAGPLDAARHGAFTYLAIGAMRGWADGQRDGVRDGKVTVEEASLYVEEGLRSLQLTDQRPERTGDGAVVLSRGTEEPPPLAPVAGGTAGPGVAYGAGSGQIQVASTAMVNLWVDGVFRPPNPLGGFVRVDNLTPGPHLVELKNGFNKVVASVQLELPPGTQVRYQYRSKTLTEIGRGPVDSKPVVAAGQAIGRVVESLGGTLDEAMDQVTEGVGVSTGQGPRNLTPQAGPQEVQAWLAAMEAIQMSDDRVAFLAELSASEGFTCAQVVELLDLIPFRADKVAAVRQIRPAVVDPENVALIVGAMTYADDRRQVEAMFRAP